jgi:Ca2+-binding EF-hand superfamily protein
MFSRTLALTLGSLALGSMSLIASPATDDAQQKPLNRIRFQQMDRNNDGAISRQEWNGSARSFQVHDWNGDGILSGNEVRTGAQRDTDLADHNPNSFERNLSWTRQSFTSLDHNRDNRLSVNEWHFDLETFRRVDSNRNDSISLQEFLGQGVEDLRGDSFDDIDNNNNGRIERAEWYGGLAEFRRLDSNNDGILSRYEVVGTTTGLTTYNQFQNLDYNRDGRLARNEWHWSNASFNQRDTNRDGILTAQEFDNAGGSPGTIGALGNQANQVAGETIRVNSQQRWTDTGITVRQGDIIRVQSSGQVQLSDNSSDMAGVAGSVQRRRAPDAPIGEAFAGALIARIGAYTPFGIGDQTQITAPVSGRLYLGVNDDHLLDNRGEFIVTLSVDRR